MHKKELIEAVAQKTGKSQKEVKETLEAILETITETVKKGDKVTLTGFGTFSVQQTKARTGRNPQTGKSIQIKAKKRPKFKAGADLSKSVN
ncbi:MAG: DNA-binding protein [Fluviicola sp.]|nr:MAG: DNA-binding protein [Fluviicola sp.]